MTLDDVSKDFGIDSYIDEISIMDKSNVKNALYSMRLHINDKVDKANGYLRDISLPQFPCQISGDFDHHPFMQSCLQYGVLAEKRQRGMSPDSDLEAVMMLHEARGHIITHTLSGEMIKDVINSPQYKTRPKELDTLVDNILDMSVASLCRAEGLLIKVGARILAARQDMST